MNSIKLEFASIPYLGDNDLVLEIDVKPYSSSVKDSDGKEGTKSFIFTHKCKISGTYILGVKWFAPVPPNNYDYDFKLSGATGAPTIQIYAIIISCVFVIYAIFLTRTILKSKNKPIPNAVAPQLPANQPNFCKYCGAPLTKNSRFCTYCGKAH